MKLLKGIKNERGMTLIEVLIALAILGLVAVAFLSGLTTVSRALLIADERTTAESLARSQMEYVKSQGYQEAEPGGEGIYLTVTDVPEYEHYILEGYTVNSLNGNDAIVEEIVGIPWFFPLVEEPGVFNPGYAVNEDVGLQMIRLVIKHGDKEVLRLDDVKVKRW